MIDRMDRSARVSTPLTMLRSSTPKAGMAGPSVLGRSGLVARRGGRLPSMRSTADGGAFAHRTAAVQLAAGCGAQPGSSASMATEKPMAAYR